MFGASFAVWAAQAASAVTVVRLASRVFASSWGAFGWRRHGEGRRGVGALSVMAVFQAMLRPLPSTADTAVTFVIMTGACLVLAARRRPIVLGGGATMVRVCIVKIGCCVLPSLHELLWALPPPHPPAFVHTLRAIGAVLMLDTLLLAFIRVPYEERHGWTFPSRIAMIACRLTSFFLPLAVVFVLLVLASFASLVPCLSILVLEGVRDLKCQRQQHD